MMLALAFNFMIAATNACIGKWNRHAVAPSDNFFTHVPFFFNFKRKQKNRLCPLPYEKVLEDIIETVGTEQCGNLKEMRYLGKAALVYPG